MSSNFSKSRLTASATQDISARESNVLRRCQFWSSLKEVCDLLNIPAAFMDTEELRFQHVQFKPGQRVHLVGQSFDALGIVNIGFLKTVQIDESGNEQVLNFPMRGDLLGVDAIHSRHYTSEAVALSDCDVILLPYKKLLALGRVHIELENVMYAVMSRELLRGQAMICMLAALSAEARVARFLVLLADRFSTMGYSKKLFNLRMTRHEIGSYLGLTMATVSRTLSAFHEIGLITVDQRTIGIKDADVLKTLRRLPPSRTRVNQKLSVEKQTEKLEQTGMAEC